MIALPGGVTATGFGGSPITVTGLANGMSYTFRVAAANAAGLGTASAPSNAVVPGLPTAPLDVAAHSGDTTVQVNWSAPAADGGSPITGYVVTPFADGVAQMPVGVGVVTTKGFAGLTNGTVYTFAVAAVNAVGTGPVATSNFVVPAVPRPALTDPPVPVPRPPDPSAPIGGTRPPPPAHRAAPCCS